jgi:hypothetical protein
MANELETQADQVLTGPVDAVGPWTIKAVPTEIRNLAISAARKEGLTVSQWLERRVREWTNEFAQVGKPSAHIGAAELEQFARVCSLLAESAGKPVPRAVTRLMWARVRERLGDGALGMGGRTQLVQIAVPGSPAGHQADEQHGEGEQ